MSEVPVARVRSLGELTEIVPYLVGFQPQESLVAMVVDRGRVTLTARTDLDEQTNPGSVEHLAGRLRVKFPTAQVFTLAYTDDPAKGWQALQRSQEILGPMTAGTVLVNGDTWYSEGLTGAVRSDGPVSAQATVLGMRRAADRSELGKTLDSPPVTDAGLAAMERAVANVPPRENVADCAAMVSDLIARNIKEPTRLGPDDAAQLAALVGLRPDTRDIALLSITSDSAQQHLQLWSAVLQQVPEDVATPPLILAGMAAWVGGEGAIASLAMERLDARDASNYGMAPLLDTLTTNMVRPQEWDQIRGQMLRDVRREPTTEINPAEQAPVWESVQPQNRGRRPEPPRAAEPPRPGPAI